MKFPDLSWFPKILNLKGRSVTREATGIYHVY